MTSIALITFDVGGTLLCPHPSVGEAYARELEALGHRTDAQRLERRFQSALQRWAYHREHLPATRDDRPLWRAVVRETLAEEAIPPDQIDPAFDRIYEAFSTARHWRVLDDVAEVLETLSERGLRLAVLSNSDTRTRRVLREHGLLDRFEAVFLSGEIGYEKPDRRLFQHVCDSMQVSPQQILHVGDSPRHDHQGATNAGWKSFLVTTSGTPLRSLLDSF